jgi:ubiquinone/menaquinone biosynthesis C-methylase UbiE
MRKEIDKLEFWKKRIEDAKQGREHYSVYITKDEHWKLINEVHNELLKELVPEGSRVLDAGCGYGRTSERFDREHYTGVDFSPDFIEIAKRKYPDKNFVVSDLKKLPFKKGEFDFAVCVSIRKMIVDNLGQEEWDKMQKELKRVAKKVLILEYEDPRPYEII